MADPIKLVPAPVKTRDGEIAEIIKRLAELHEGDEIESMVVYLVRKDGCNAMKRTSSGDTLRLIGGLSWAQQRLIQDYDAMPDVADDHT